MSLWDRDAFVEYFESAANAKLKSVKLRFDIRTCTSWNNTYLLTITGTSVNTALTEYIVKDLGLSYPKKYKFRYITIVKELVEFLRKDMGEPKEYGNDFIVYSWADFKELDLHIFFPSLLLSQLISLLHFSNKV